MTKIIELRPDNSLSNSKFEKYQFSAEDVPINSVIPITGEVFRTDPGLNQDSWLEAQLFAFHNHLFLNPYDNSFWFITKDGKVWKYDNNNINFIHQLSTNLNDSIYNPTIAFTTNKIVAILDGNKTLEILITYDNQDVKSHVFNNTDPSILLDIRYVRAKLLLIIAVCSIIEVDKKKHFEITIQSYSCKTNETFIEIHEKIRTQVFRVKGAIEYFFIEENGDYFHTASQDSLVFHFDSLNPNKSKNVDKEEKQPQIKIPKYSWSQDEESLTVWVKIPEKFLTAEAKVEITPIYISVIVGDFILIQGETPHRLETDLTTWKRKEDTLELELYKHENGQMWSELIKGDTGGEFLPNDPLTAEIHSRLAHLCTDQPQNNATDGQPALGFNAEQLEECDLQGRENLLQRVNLNTHGTTHLTMLGNSSRILFSRKLKNNQMICLRYDHDGCIWFLGKGDEETWQLKHMFTFPGFGYIEASKTNKKFCMCPTDGSYIIILEHTRHALVYERPEKDSTIGKQKIIDFCTDTPIIGAGVIDKYLYVLTKYTLYQLQISS